MAGECVRVVGCVRVALCGLGYTKPRGYGESGQCTSPALPHLERAVPYDALRRVYSGIPYRVWRSGAAEAGGLLRAHSDHTADLTLLLECMLTVFDLKVLAPIGSDAGERGGAARQRGASFGFGNTARRAAS